MTDNVSLYRAFIHCIIQNRSECLDNYVVIVRSLGGHFLQEDRLLLMVRGGSLLDALLENLPTNRMDILSEYFNADSRQLLAAGYSIEQLKALYNSFEQAILAVVERKMQGQPGLLIASRSVKSAMLLANIIAVNHHMTVVATSISSRALSTVEPQRVTLPSRVLPLKEEATSNSSFNKPARFKPSAENHSSKYDGKYSSGSTPDQNDKSQPNFEARLGYLIWPLQVVSGTTPPEYQAYLADGTPTQALLVDRPEAYAPPSQFNSNNASCRIRQVGPVTLAYPL